jgi:hypothetical protein
MQATTSSSDQWTRFYQQQPLREAPMHYGNIRRSPFMLQYLTAILERCPPGGRTLEAGCGTGPAARLVSTEATPEESLLRKQVRDYFARALSHLTTQQVELFALLYEQGESAADLQELTGRSAVATRNARKRMRARLRSLLVAAGLDDSLAGELLSEIDRMHGAG